MEPFKNQLSYPKARRIADAIKRAHPAFSTARYANGLEASISTLELKDRMRLIADRIESCLPEHPPELFSVLVAALATDDSNSCGLRGFLVWPLTEIVARRGLGHFPEAMAALAEMTRRFTAEFAIRPFLRQHRERTLKQLHAWCKHPDPHVRRLVSEGSRPLLPWGGNLTELLEAPFPTLPLLEKLHRDASEYVRLSVSNHLNDFSKHHPELVIETLTRWRQNAPDDPRLDKLARHACRTLLKSGHPGALGLHGFGPAKSLMLESNSLSNASVKLGGHLEYRLVIRNASHKPVRVMFDYAIHHRKANGGLSPKVFKGRVRELAAAERWEISARHPIRAITTRVYHAGWHTFEPRINGKVFPAIDFLLEIWAPTAKNPVREVTTGLEALKAINISEDFSYTGGDAKTDVSYFHRRDANTEIYFVASRSERPESLKCRFRVTGMTPELWDPVTGERRAVAFGTSEDGTTITIDFDPCGSVFVVFREPSTGSTQKPTTSPTLITAQEITGPWTVSFDPKWGGPPSAIFNELVSWTTRPEPGIKHYSGTATYRKTFDLTDTPGASLHLDLGQVAELAEVRLNGKSLGIVWTPPFRVSLGSELKATGNQLEIDVVNFWPNRIIGDASLPVGKRHTKTNIRKLTADVQLMPSGLLGPVRILKSE